jgi:GNAT superfamily N-acetyltransferase
MVEIRPLTRDDIDPVAAVHVRACQAGYAGILPADGLDALDPADRAARLRDRPPGPGERTLVAVVDGAVAGFAMLGPYRGEDGPGELYALYVDPGRWGAGTGRALLTAARAELSGAGYPEMRLWVLEANRRGRRFYERAGLTPDGVRQMYTPRGGTVEVPKVRYTTRL